MQDRCQLIRTKPEVILHRAFFNLVGPREPIFEIAPRLGLNSYL